MEGKPGFDESKELALVRQRVNKKMSGCLTIKFARQLVTLADTCVQVRLV